MKYEFPTHEKICDICYGGGKIHINEFTDRFSDRLKMDGVCYKCNGTGLLVKEMDTNEKLEYLLNVLMEISR